MSHQPNGDTKKAPTGRWILRPLKNHPKQLKLETRGNLKATVMVVEIGR